MLTQIYTTFLDFMMILLEASKCIQVDDATSLEWGSEWLFLS